jgi:anti-sigma regulatory factor (Ser/Thr protein kinase)/predicted Ser/Thr protein kinase
MYAVGVELNHPASDANAIALATRAIYYQALLDSLLEAPMGEHPGSIYYLRDRWLVGPVGKDELRSLLDAGALNEKALTWTPGQQSWATPSELLSASDETVEIQPCDRPEGARKGPAGRPDLPSPRNLLALRLASEQELVTSVQKERLLNVLFVSPDPDYDLLAGLQDKGWITASQRATLDAVLGRGSMPELIGDHEIVRELGRGGMGTTHLARQLSLDRLVALKILLPKLSQDEEYIRRFKHEARMAARLNHENVAAAHDVGEAAGRHWISMEYVDGRTVGELVDEKGQLPEKEAVDITVQVCRALAHAQEHDLIHRDVKPDNIIVKPNGRAKLIDMGLAKSTGPEGTRLTATGSAPCTPDYASPEQARGKKDLDIRSDIYSLGCTLYAMLTGSVPFAGSTPAETVNMHVNDPLPPVRELRPDASDRICRVVERMTAKRPEDRCQTPDEVIAELTDKVGPVGAPVGPRASAHPVVEQLASWQQGAPVEMLLHRDWKEYTHLVAMKLDEHLEQAKADAGFQGDIQTIFAELLANAFDHGCKDVTEGDVRIRMELNPAFFSLEVEDPGPGFPAEETLEQLKSKPLRRLRGRGMLQVHNIADVVTYSPKGNLVKAILYRKAEGSGIFTHERDGIMFVEIRGRAFSLPESFKRWAHDYDARTPRRVCLMVRTKYVLSFFMGFIIAFHDALAELGSALTVWVERKNCYKSMEDLGITALVPIYTSFTEAEHALRDADVEAPAPSSGEKKGLWDRLRGLFGT